MTDLGSQFHSIVQYGSQVMGAGVGQSYYAYN